MDLKFFNKLGAKARIAVIFGSVIGLIALIYVGVQMTSDDASIRGSKVKAAPKNLKSVPGGKLTAEYYRALEKANKQAAQKAEMSGTSAIPTLVNVGGPSVGSLTRTVKGDCNVVCSDEQVNVGNTLEDMVRNGSITPEVSADLQKLADADISVDEYEQELAQLVKEGKLTPEQARKLLDQYKKQHANKRLKESAAAMDAMIKMGDLSLETANELLAMQKEKASPADYAAKLQELVRQGKISPETAKKLLAQYKQQHAKGIVDKSIASLKKLGKDGMLTKDVEVALIALEERMVPLSEYESALKKFVDAGKLIPATSKKIIEEYKWQKSQMGSPGEIMGMIDKVVSQAQAQVNDLLQSGRITPDVAKELAKVMKKTVSREECIATVEKLTAQGKVQRSDSASLISKCKQIAGIQKVVQRLPQLEANNATVDQYREELRRAVAAGAISPENATALLQKYKEQVESMSPSSLPRAAAQTEAGAGDGQDFDRFSRGLESINAELQQQSAGGGRGAQGAASSPTGRFSSIQARAQQEREKAREKAIAVEEAAMTGYSGKLIASWQPPVMQQQGSVVPFGSEEEDAEGMAGGGKDGAGEMGGSNGAGGAALKNKAPLIKAGTITFAVLDTAINSDYPDSPVMATVVDGPLKGAKLLGKLQTSSSPTGQNDRVMLNFDKINFDKWDSSKSVTAFAVDPDTARTMLASSVDYHYMKRFGAMFATAFLEGYAQAITNAGTTVTTAAGSTTTSPVLTSSEKLFAALGNMGKVLGEATKKYVDLPPTVKVNAGVGLGIMFMADVTDEEEPTSNRPGQIQLGGGSAGSSSTGSGGAPRQAVASAGAR